MGPGALTAQVDCNHIDGDTTFTALPEQDTMLFEIGFLLRGVRLTLVFQYNWRGVADTTSGMKTAGRSG